MDSSIRAMLPPPAPITWMSTLGEVILVLVDQAAVGEGRFATVDDADVEGGAAHIGGDDVLVTHDAAGITGPGDAGDRARIEGQQRCRHRLGDGDRATRALGDLQRMTIAELGRPLVHAGEIAGHERADIGVERHRRGPLVLAPFGHELGGAGDEEAGRDALDHRLDPALVIGREEGPEEADRERFHAGVHQPADRLLPPPPRSSATTTLPKQSTLSDTPSIRYLGTMGSGLLLSRYVDDEADIAAGEPARAAHDVDDVVVALGV